MPPNYSHAVYAGSFDPVTLGHISIIERGLRAYDRVTVAIGVNAAKSGLFGLAERKRFIEETLGPRPGLEVLTFQGLLVSFAGSIGAGVLLRGLRLLTDFEREFQLALANRSLAPEIETVFLLTESELVHVSSSLVKEIAANQGELSSFVPPPVKLALLKKFPVREV